MRSSSIAVLFLAAQLLCGCQIMSGLSDLQARQERADPSQMTEPIDVDPTTAPETTNGGRADAGTDAGVLPSGKIGNMDETPEEKEENAPEEQQTRSMMDAGLGDHGDSDDPGNAGGRGGGARNRGPTAGAAGVPTRAPIGPIAGGGGSAGGPDNNSNTAGTGGSASEAETEPACMYPTAALSCSVTQQCGCDERENCAVEDARVQCIAAGTSLENQYCGEARDCTVGYQCASNACLKHCDPDHPACDGGAACVQLFWGTEPVSGVFMCASACNPVDPQTADGELNACGAGLICAWWDNGTFCSYSDHATRRHGEFCRDQYDCASGYACAESATCAKWCASNTDCPSGFTCALDAPVVMGQKSFGMCKPDCLDRNERICGLSTQCGCDNNHSCDTWLNDDNEVVHECRQLGRVGLYQTCDSAYDCGREAQCVGSQCRPVCLTDYDCPRYATCELSYFDDAPFMPAGATCRRPCDPADPYNAHGQYGSCNSGAACDISSDGISYCRSADLRGTAGAVCDDDNDCSVGFTCTSNGDCVGLCRGTSDCSSGSCHAFSTAQFAADVEWGYCASP
jgi:hypothetical protein